MAKRRQPSRARQRRISPDDLSDQRRRTAMARTSLSRPFALALRDQLVTPDTTVLDYGCGGHRDLELLTRLGIPAVGWDPAHRPDQERRP